MVRLTLVVAILAGVECFGAEAGRLRTDDLDH